MLAPQHGLGSLPSLDISDPSSGTCHKHLPPKGHVLLELPKTVVELEDNGLGPGKPFQGAEPRAMAGKAALTAMLNSSWQRSANMFLQSRFLHVLGAAAGKLIQQKGIPKTELCPPLSRCY